MNDSRTQRTHSGDLTGSPEDYSADTTMGQSSEVLPSGDYAADFNPSRRHVLHLVPVALALMAVLLAAAPSSAGVMADFNGDGFTDLAVAAPFSTNGRGEVIIIFGSPAGLTGTGSLLLVSPRGDNFGDPGEFGRALAAGDFDGDGFADLVVGEPGFDFRPAGFPDFIIDAGAIHIFRGPDFSRQAIFVNHLLQVGREDTPAVSLNDGDRLGQTLAVGDFNGDGRPDLAIGIPLADDCHLCALPADAGGVLVIYSSSASRLGLDFSTREFWSQAMPGVRGAAQERDRFGTALATGDFNDDGKDDLAIGVPGEDSNTGLVHILYGRGGVGLTAANTQSWTQDTDGLKGTAERGDRFGAALAAADFNGDGQDDLAIGIPNDAVESFDRAGAVQVLYSASGGLTATDQLWTLSVLGVRGIPAANDHFGTALAWGDFNGNGRADLAIGMPGKDVLVNGVLREFAGAVQVLYGSDNRLTVTGNQHWILGRNGLASKPGNGDQFGGALH